MLVAGVCECIRIPYRKEHIAAVGRVRPHNAVGPKVDASVSLWDGWGCDVRPVLGAHSFIGTRVWNPEAFCGFS